MLGQPQLKGIRFKGPHTGIYTLSGHVRFPGTDLWHFVSLECTGEDVRRGRSVLQMLCEHAESLRATGRL